MRALSCSTPTLQRRLRLGEGVVEKNVQDSRRRIWQEAAERRFATLMELNVWLEQRCRAPWSELRHPQHEQLSVAEMLEHEQSHLIALTLDRRPLNRRALEPSRVPGLLDAALWLRTTSPSSTSVLVPSAILRQRR